MNKQALAAVAGMAIFGGVPVLCGGGWAEFARSPARLAYLAVTLVAQVLIAARVPQAGFSRAAGATVVARQRIAVVLLQLVTVGIVVLAPLADARGWGALPEAVRYAGLAIYVAGLWLMNWSIVWLGRFFSVQVTVQADHRLVTDGPYRLVRHPRYAGIFLCFAGLALVFAAGPALLLAGLLLLTLLWRVHDEEAFMASSFPAEWPAYAQRTARLVPGVW